MLIGSWPIDPALTYSLLSATSAKSSSSSRDSCHGSDGALRAVARRSRLERACEEGGRAKHWQIVAHHRSVAPSVGGSASFAGPNDFPEIDSETVSFALGAISAGPAKKRGGFLRPWNLTSSEPSGTRPRVSIESTRCVDCRHCNLSGRPPTAHQRIDPDS